MVNYSTDSITSKTKGQIALAIIAAINSAKLTFMYELTGGITHNIRNKMYW